MGSLRSRGFRSDHRLHLLSVRKRMRFVVALTGVAAVLGLCHDPLAAQQIRAERITGPAPEIDGRLDDRAWVSAALLDDFRQTNPVEGAQVGRAACRERG